MNSTCLQGHISSFARGRKLIARMVGSSSSGRLEQIAQDVRRSAGTPVALEQLVGMPVGAPTRLTAKKALAAAPPAVQKQIIGEKLYAAISRYPAYATWAGKITGMMLEMDNSELLMMLESEETLKAKCDKAIRVLDAKVKGWR